MTKATLATLSTLLLLSACGGSDQPAESDATSVDDASETGFDEQLSDEEANAALDALDAEEASASTE